MNDEFYKNILNNIDFNIIVTDLSGNVIFSNNDIVDFKEYPKQLISVNDKKYYIYSNSSLKQSQQDFISTISHELRTPLTSIRGFADTLLSSFDMLSNEQRNKFLTIIRNQADRLTRLVENLLEISNISKNNNLIFKNINFKKFVTPLITIFERKYNNKKYVLSCKSDLPDIWSDADLLEQIMTNLIDNASKYSDDNATITIKSEFANDYVNIMIIDEAIKIPKDKMKTIFDKFERIENPLTQKVEGSGLGLFITKKLVDKLNGIIEVDNYENGNIFTVKLKVLSVENQLSSITKGSN